jgi:hypothetical protein
MDARILIGIIIFFVIAGLLQRLVLDAIWDAGKPKEPVRTIQTPVFEYDSA